MQQGLSQPLKVNVGRTVADGVLFGVACKSHERVLLTILLCRHCLLRRLEPFFYSALFMCLLGCQPPMCEFFACLEALYRWHDWISAAIQL